MCADKQDMFVNPATAKIARKKRADRNSQSILFTKSDACNGVVARLFGQTLAPPVVKNKVYEDLSPLHHVCCFSTTGGDDSTHLKPFEAALKICLDKNQDNIKKK